MKIRFWGVRGSIPSPGPETVRYGGNTACIEIRGEKGECVILDAGSGLRLLGNDLIKRKTALPTIHLFITHTHWDHIQGFPFFVPCYIPGTAIQVKGPVHFIEKRSLQDIFDIQMQYDFFPVSNQQLTASLNYEALHETSLNIGSLQITTQFTNHPIRCLGYRIAENKKSVVYTGDHEPYYNLFDTGLHDDSPSQSSDDILFGGAEDAVREANRRFVDFLRDTDLLIIDSQYTPNEYPSQKRNWGHSSWDYCLQWMRDAGVSRMALTHHDPLRTDAQLDTILEHVQAEALQRGITPGNVMLAREGLELEL